MHNPAYPALIFEHDFFDDDTNDLCLLRLQTATSTQSKPNARYLGKARTRALPESTE